ncbi:hypothetical protein [Streptomyces sp. NPDC050287]|uniref:hypothetical protein n=1 Tax=Streptomyces sp. NPDC050287 TaxID=3365608 RepID=UPI00379D8340
MPADLQPTADAVVFLTASESLHWAADRAARHGRAAMDGLHELRVVALRQCPCA